MHLHNHTEYSLLDGAARVDGLARAAAEQEQRALAITDHGYMFGAYEFWDAAKNHGVKPIIGLEGYLTPGTHRTDTTRTHFAQGGKDDVSANGAYTHITLWSETTEGMHNLFRLASLASLEGQRPPFAKWPRSDRELLQRFSKGLIATTGCPSGEVQTKLRLGQYKEALQAAADFRDIFGPENYFVELMDHGLKIERRTREGLLQIARDLSIPLVATNDVHYTHESDASMHETMLCLNSGSNLSEPTYDEGGKRFAFSGTGYYLKSAAEMRHLFRELPEACDNTLLIAERCESEFEKSTGKYMPRFPVPEGESERSHFAAEVQEGLRRRYGANVPAEVQEQAEYEIGVIADKGYPSYFLVVADFITWAKDNGIRVGPGRGSGAGSMCAYAMGITDLDPLKHGLIFERFLNPERDSMPDFDIDFDERRREEVVRYVKRKYGRENVTQIVTYGTYKPKQSIKDSARALGYPFSFGDKLTKALPATQQGKDVPLAKLHDPEHPRYAEGSEFRALRESDPDVGKVHDLAQQLEGLTRQWGVHAAGVIMSSVPIMDVIPVHRRVDDGAIITQFDYPTCETLGLVKMDFLGLSNLTILSDALDNIERAGKGTVTLEDLPDDDEKTFRLLQRAETLGVFQLDSDGVRSLLKQMRPDTFADISATLALYRPGPMGMDSHTKYALRKAGRQPITPIHPELEEPLADILAETYGLIVYQESVMEIAQKVAGYSLGEADLLRRAMGKKKKDVLDKEYERFERGMRERGYSQAAILALWRTLLPFADYAFNKSHSAAYGLISYYTAYLKAHYPVEYMAALLTSVSADKDKLAFYLHECRRMGVSVLQPDVNESQSMFTAVGDVIRFGFAAISGVGQGLAQTIIAAREQEGPFESFEQFAHAMPVGAATKKSLDALIKAGAFDSLGHSRMGLSSVYEAIADEAKQLNRRAEHGEFTLFGDDEDFRVPVDIPEREWEKKERLAFERDVLGLYVSDHPLTGLEEMLSTYRDVQAVDLAAVVEKQGKSSKRQKQVTLSGLAATVERKTSRKGDAWGTVVLEDMTGQVKCLVFPKTFAKVQQFLVQDSLVIVQGKVSARDEEGAPELFVDDLVPMPEA